MSLRIVSIHLRLGRPRGRFPSTSILCMILPMWSSDRRSTWPYHRSRCSCAFSMMGTTQSRCRISVLRILSSLVTLHVHRSILISVVWSICSCLLAGAQHLLPYSSAGRTTVRYTLRLSRGGIFLSQSTPEHSRHLSQPQATLFLMSASMSPSSQSTEPWYLNSSTLVIVAPSRWMVLLLAASSPVAMFSVLPMLSHRPWLCCQSFHFCSFLSRSLWSLEPSTMSSA
uniref:Uncharacterized protein n=1 Tax=Plectus sambesii TaxID=2011161 RepID=A0A914W388_9BILA